MFTFIKFPVGFVIHVCARTVLRYYLLMVSFILSLLMGFNAHANCEKRFVLGFVNTAPSYTVENGEKKGLSYELIQEVSRRLGCRSTEFTGPLAAVQEGLKKNSIDIYGLIAPSN